MFQAFAASGEIIELRNLTQMHADNFRRQIMRIDIFSILCNMWDTKDEVLVLSAAQTLIELAKHCERTSVI